MIRLADSNDAAGIAAIYNPYILDTIITFEEEPLAPETVVERVDRVSKTFPWLVFEQQGKLLGYAYAQPWKDRSAYRYTCETSIYLAQDARGKGIGVQLYTELLDRLSQHGMRVAIAGIALPNPASIALHEKLGFHKVAHFEAVGIKFNRQIDVGYWQRSLAT